MVCVGDMLCVGQDQSEGRITSLYSLEGLLELILRASDSNLMNEMGIFLLRTSF